MNDIVYMQDKIDILEERVLDLEAELYAIEAFCRDPNEYTGMLIDGTRKMVYDMYMKLVREIDQVHEANSILSMADDKQVIVVQCPRCAETIEMET